MENQQLAKLAETIAAALGEPWRTKQDAVAYVGHYIHGEGKAELVLSLVGSSNSRLRIYGSLSVGKNSQSDQ